MNKADPLRSLMHRAGALLARRAYSRGQLRDKLAPHADPPQIEAALDRLQQLNLLNDADYAYNSAVRWIKQEGWGAYKVRHRLLLRQIPEHTAEAAIERVRQEISDARALADYLDRRERTQPLPEDRKGIHKLIMSLRRRGFPEEAIWNVLRRRIPAASWQKFEPGD